MNAGWVGKAPKRLAPLVVASLSTGGEHSFASVSLAFAGLEESETITVTVVASEFELRKFQKDLDRAVTRSLRASRG